MLFPRLFYENSCIKLELKNVTGQSNWDFLVERLLGCRYQEDMSRLCGSKCVLRSQTEVERGGWTGSLMRSSGKQNILTGTLLAKART